MCDVFSYMIIVYVFIDFVFIEGEIKSMINFSVFFVYRNIDVIRK